MHTASYTIYFVNFTRLMFNITQVTTRILFATSKWLARRLGSRSLRQSLSLPLPRPTALPISRNSSPDQTTPRSSRSESAATTKRCTKRRNFSSTTCPTLPVLLPPWSTWESSRMLSTRLARQTPPEHGKRCGKHGVSKKYNMYMYM